jgi:tRNA threonylcarbamoyladenosine biosynthesis protein TsaB
MYKILCLDTSSTYLSMALSDGDQRWHVHKPVAQSHTQHIIPELDRLLVTAKLQIKQLDAIAFGRGPGSFTGLRIAASVCHGLTGMMDLPLIPVSTLATLAQTGFRLTQEQRFISCIDARMKLNISINIQVAVPHYVTNSFITTSPSMPANS